MSNIFNMQQTIKNAQRETPKADLNDQFYKIYRSKYAIEENLP